MNVTNEPNSSGSAGASQAPAASTPTSTPSATATAGASPNASAAPSTGASAASSATPTGVPKDGAAPSAPVVPPAYQPNFKFKAFREEKEIDELFRGIIKDPDTEKKVKELHERAYALDPMKSERDEWKTKFTDINTQYSTLNRSVEQLNKFLVNKDFTNLFAATGVKEEDIFNWVQQRLEYMSLPPEKRAMIDQQSRLQMDAYTKEAKLNEFETREREHLTKLRTIQFETLMSRNDIHDIAKKWDSQAGMDGAFKQLVIEEATKHFYITSRLNPDGMGEDLSPEQAVELVLKKFGKFISAGETAAAQPNLNGAPASAQPGATATPPPVIPHVPGRATSPVKKQVRSLDDLRALEKSM